VTATEALIIVAMALAVYLPKAVPLIVVSEGLSARLAPWLKYVAPAVLGALIAPAIVGPSGQPTAPGWDLVPYVAAFAAAVRTRRMLPALAVGLFVLLVVAIFRPA
jgi:branched-subunit amino acid transport protein